MFRGGCYVAVILGLCRGYIGDILGFYKGYIRVILGLHRGGNVLDVLRKCFQGVWEMCLLPGSPKP